MTLDERVFAGVHPPSETPGLFITNPPYGERIGEGSALPELYAQMGDVLRRRFLGWSAFIFSGNPSLQRNIGLKAARRHVLFNGPIECRLLEYPIEEAPVRSESPGWRATSKEAEMFKNRLRKNRRRWEKWAKRQRVDCYRIYDADIPEYNVAIDRYGDEFVLHEYRAPKKIPAGHAERRLRDAISLTLEEFGVARSALHLRVRKRQQGGKQYERREEEGERREVQENGHRFLVNLDEYLDAGIFLDQRPLRRLIQKEAQGKSFLNLFAYTGSATVYAAKGGATETLTVDLSNTYNSWARSNFDLNRMARHQHRIQRADCLEWLKGNHGKFDRILLAPPSYSRSRAMRGDFDLVRDYLPLIQETVRHLATGGVLYFVHHARGFKLDASALPDLDCVDTSKDTVAPDFVRSPHQSWRISKKRKAH